MASYYRRNFTLLQEKGQAITEEGARYYRKSQAITEGSSYYRRRVKLLQKKGHAITGKAKLLQKGQAITGEGSS